MSVLYYKMTIDMHVPREKRNTPFFTKKIKYWTEAVVVSI